MNKILPVLLSSALLSSALLLASTASHAATGVPKGVEFLNAEKPTDKSYPISEAVKVGKIIYLSGRLGTEPGTSKLADGGISGEARQAMENIKTWLEKHGYSMVNVVKCTIFLADAKELKDFNDVYKTYFPNLNFPARSAIGVSGLALNARVEVECIAAVDK